MADNDFRNGGGPRGGGYNNNRKRRREDDNDHYDGRQQDDRRGPQRRRQNEGPRRRGDDHALPKIRRVLLNVASSTMLPQDEVLEIAQDIADNSHDEYLKDAIIDISILLVIEQPFKIPFVAAVFYYINDLNPDITAEAIKRVASRTQQELDAGHWKEFKLLLRFFACLQSIFEGDGIFTYLGQLFDTVVDLQSANENDMVGVELVKIILLTIPYAMVSGGTKFQQQARELLNNTGIVAGNVFPMEGFIHAYTAEGPVTYHSVIGLLQSQLMNEAENGWEFACIPRFDPNRLRKRDGDEDMSTEPKAHTFPTLTFPSPVNPGSKPLFPEPFFSIFSDQEIETIPKTSDIASSLLRDAVVDTIDQLDFNREGAAKFLTEIDCYWTEKTFAKRGTPFDKLQESFEGDKVVWKSEDLMIDAIFSQLFKLPSPDHKLVYYHSLITTCCKIAPAFVAPSLGRAIRAVYKALDVIDLELANRYVDWYSHHLSNFEFRWRWEEWLDDLSLSELHPKRCFMSAALDREIRLSFAKRIRSTIPKPMHFMIPSRLDEDNSPEFKYDKDTTPFATEGRILIQQLRKRVSQEEIQETINAIHEKAVEQSIPDVLVPSTDAFVTAICRLGAKSSSHVLSCIERGKTRLLEIAGTSEAARRQIVTSVVEYWKDQPGNAVHIIDVLINYSVLAPMTVAQWALGEHVGAGEGLSKAWLYEMVSNTVAKVANRNRQIVKMRCEESHSQTEVDSLEAALPKSREAARELFKYLEDTLRGLAQGGDVLMEKESLGEISAEDGQLIRAWAQRWHTVFLRKAQAEEAAVGEDAVARRLAFAPEALPDKKDITEADGNGVEDAVKVDEDEML